MIEGIDVSNHQGYIDWAAVRAAGKRFMFAKASEGLQYADPYHAANIQGAALSRIIPGSYHYAQPEQGSGADQAYYFLDQAQPTTGQLLALDLEEGPPGAGLADFAVDFLETCYVETGCKPLLYSAWSFLHEHGLASDTRLSDYGLWQASWQAHPPTVPDAWETWAFWQYSAVGQCDGVSGNCDLDKFNGTLSQLRKYAV